MATELPRPSKRQKREHLNLTQTQQPIAPTPGPELQGSFKARFVDSDGNQLADVVEVPVADATEKNISLLLNTLLGRERDEFLPYRFRIHLDSVATKQSGENGEAEDGTTTRTTTTIETFPNPTDFLKVLRDNGITNPFETTLTLAADPQSIFRVNAVTRMAARIPGHAEAILCAAFSPFSSARLATGSGDCTARIWDADTGTPKYTLKGHTGWVLCLRWSPDGGTMLATGSMDKGVRIWDPETGKEISAKGGMSGHGKWVTDLAWEPYHSWKDGIARLASSSKDCTIRVYVASSGRTEFVLSGHKASVSCVRWGGMGWIYSASQDKTVRVWDAEKGTLVHTLQSHRHWVNCLALSSDFVLRTGWIDPHASSDKSLETEDDRRARAKERFENASRIQGEVRERLVSASDDCTMFLWDPQGKSGTKPVERMLGHQKGVNHVTFSPDGTRIASSGFDNHVKLWNGRDGKFITTLRGHVQATYQSAFSADSRLLVSASKDTTLKVWSVASGKMVADLPSHEDEVYAVDWSPDGQKVGSGGKDKAVRVWRN